MKTGLVLFGGLCLLAAAPSPAGNAQAPLGVVILNGHVVDGTG